VPRKERDELLADHAGRAEDPDFNLSHDDSLFLRAEPDGLHCSRSKKKADAVASADKGSWNQR
jgi:hypothetical protein